MTFHASLALKEVRCVRCGRLLLKWRMAGPGHVEVKCPRCQQMSFFIRGRFNRNDRTNAWRTGYEKTAALLIHGGQYSGMPACCSLMGRGVEYERGLSRPGVLQQ